YEAGDLGPVGDLLLQVLGLECRVSDAARFDHGTASVSSKCGSPSSYHAPGTAHHRAKGRGRGLNFFPRSSSLQGSASIHAPAGSSGSLSAINWASVALKSPNRFCPIALAHCVSSSSTAARCRSIDCQPRRVRNTRRLEPPF